MGTDAGDALFGKTRQAILGLLFHHPDKQFYLREIVRRTGGGIGAVQRELALLNAAGIVRKDRRGNQAFFAVDTTCPICDELMSIVMKTAGLADVLRNALIALSSKVDVAFVFGSFATGRQGIDSDVDVLVIARAGGSGLLGKLVSATKPAQARLGREVNPILYSRAEFREKLRERHHFVTRVRAAKKIFLIGNEHEFDRLAQERLASAVPARPLRDRRAVRGRAARPER